MEINDEKYTLFLPVNFVRLITDLAKQRREVTRDKLNGQLRNCYITKAIAEIVN